MFHSARVTLTAWYLCIIMMISIIFSSAFYYVATSEIERIINRLEYRRIFPDLDMPTRLPRSYISNTPTLEELEHAKQQLLVSLIIINCAIFVVAGGGGYFLAGRTLAPIEEMVEEQRQFITDSSHELRTPIATLRSEMEGSLLEKHISDKKARQVIMSNLEELGTLQELTNNLLKITQLHTAKNDITFSDLSIEEVIKTAQKKVTPLAKQKNISITVSIKNQIIQGDKKSVHELFVILFDNAIKYSPQNTNIIVSSKTKKENVVIVVQDEGIGISKEDLPHIYNRFYRADKSRSKAEGYGLGLSIAKRIVEIHNGTISVKSVSNKGSTFTVSLPIQQNSLSIY